MFFFIHMGSSREIIGMQISRAHRGKDVSNNRKSNQKTEHRPITAQFVNWRIAEEIWNSMVHLNTTNQLNIVANQMFSKELTARRNNALIKRKKYMMNHKNLQIRLDFPATLKTREKGLVNKKEQFS